VADDSPDISIEAAGSALRAADWDRARALYRDVLERDDVGEGHFGLGVAQWWLGETEESLRCWERAYVEFRRAADPAQAVLAAFYLCLAYRMSLGNGVAANGWLERATALVDEHDLAPVAGWVLLARAYSANDSNQAAHAEDFARQAIALAKDFGDTDLSICATSELGAALLALGKLEEGTSLLDQAMAAALGGEGSDLDTVVLVSCRTITACRRAADIKRAAQWISAADGFQRTYGSTHLFTTCRTHHGAVLFAAGHWALAEAELEAALAAGGPAETALRADAAASLAELRIAQGRIGEAQRLLGGLEDQPATTYAQVRFHLATGRAAMGATVARRGLRQVGDLILERSRLLDVLAEAAPQEAFRGLSDHPPTNPVAAAFWSRARGRARLATNDPTGLRDLEDALAAFAVPEMPYESARTRMLLAAELAAKETEVAVGEARVALAILEQLGATHDADAAASFLRGIGARANRSAPRGLSLLTRRESEVLALLGEGLSNPAISQRLYISRRTVEHHVASVLSKLGLSGRTEAAAYAARMTGDSSEEK
jgi:DNA-binding CsgD family transcriptional regulator